MAQHLPGKVARLIGDLRTIFALVDLIEHEMEQRIVARHAWVKIDSLLNLAPRLKNDYRRTLCGNDGRKVTKLDGLIGRLRADYEGTQLALVRDAMAGHALKLDLAAIDASWRFMCATTFGVIASDLEEIEAELAAVAGAAHITAGTANVDKAWPAQWRHADWLGDPRVPRFAVIYPAFGTANIASPLPGGHDAQDVTIRAAGLATYLRQVRILLEVMSPGSVAERLLAEMMLNDYCALWELLFDGNVRNDYGNVDQSVLDHWSAGTDPFDGAACLARLKAQPHPDFEKWRAEVRNKVSAHVDPDEPIRIAELSHWPMSRADLIEEVGRVVMACRECARMDIRSQVLFAPPTAIKGAVGLTRQDGLPWDKS